MSSTPLPDRLSQISTLWTILRQAHATSPEEARRAQERLLQRYSVAVFQYLSAAVRDPHVAQDLFQEFALRFVRGDFWRASPERGRFRDFLRTSLYHLIVDQQRQRPLLQLREAEAERLVDQSSTSSEDQLFLDQWREDLIRQTFAALAEWEQRTGQPFHTLLRLRTDQPDLSSAQLAANLVALLGKSVSVEWVRNRLHAARQKFTDLLVAEVAQTLAEPTPEAIESELIDLGLLDRCRQALGRLRNATES